MKQPTKKTGIRNGMLLLPLAILLLLACNGGHGRLINGGYPLPGPEESAVRKLCDTLGTIEGQSLNGTQLAAMRYGVDFHPDTFGIDLPDDQIKQVIEGVTSKLDLGSVDMKQAVGLLGKLKGILGK